jgi:hypothetical protein
MRMRRKKLEVFGSGFALRAEDSVVQSCAVMKMSKKRLEDSVVALPSGPGTVMFRGRNGRRSV